MTSFFTSRFNTMRKSLQTPNQFLFYVLVGVACSLIAFSFLISSPTEILIGLDKIIRHPSTLITDYFVVGGAGAALFNGGVVALIFLALLKRYNSKISGLTFAAIFLLIGFSFLGKNILNIWSIISGVYLYTYYHKQKFSSYIYVAIFATAMSPLVSEFIMFLSFPLPVKIIIGTLLGAAIGFMIPPLSTHLLRTHQGYNLYNVGFTTGLLLTIIVAILKSIGFNPLPQMIWGTEFNALLAPFLYILFGSFIILAFIHSRHAFYHYKQLFSYSGRLVTDFLSLEHLSGTLLNMGINGILSTSFVLLVGSHLNGPTVGGIFTIVGFSAFGKHLKNIYPITIGIILNTILNGYSLQTPSVILAALLSTGLAPVAGQYGVVWGIIAGYIHLSVNLHVSHMHGGLNLYSNGFAAGLVAAILIPIIDSFRKDDSL